MDDKLIFKIIEGVVFEPTQGYEADHADIVGEERLIKFSASVPSGWQDMTSIENVHKYGAMTGRDYRYCREVMRTLVGSFASLSTIEKAIVAEHMCVWDGMEIDYATLVGYYMGQGLSQDEAQLLLIDTEIDIIRPRIRACSTERYKHAQKVVAMFLNPAGIADIFERTQHLVGIFKSDGVLGTGYRNITSGIMDFVESTDGYATTGLAEQNYALNFGTTALFISSLKNALYYGKFEIS